ncbi:MAG: hypothetical protein K2X77_13170 [Candidatus Obscuribacterales bacterium]|nr:hypothetical protein [Candidatus Obscuribacterales bacterium]
MAKENETNEQEHDQKVLHSEDGMDGELTPGSANDHKANQTKHGGTAAGTEMLLQMDESSVDERKKNEADDYSNDFKDNG